MIRRRPRAMTVTITLKVRAADRRMTGLRASRILEVYAWRLADDLTGLLTYGGPALEEKPRVEVAQVVVKEGR